MQKESELRNQKTMKLASYRVWRKEGVEEDRERELLPAGFKYTFTFRSRLKKYILKKTKINQ